MKKELKLTEEQKWFFVDSAVKAFIAQYPTACMQFFQEIKTNKTEHGLSKDKELRKSHHRCTLSFPIVRNINGDDDCLLPIIERYMPNFTNKNSRYYTEFIRRYPNFSEAKKL